MERIVKLYIFLMICCLSVLFPGCQIVRPPSLTTAEVTNIEPTTATGGGDVTNDGNSDILVRGVCWSVKKMPDLKDDRTTDGYGSGSYTSSLTGLQPNTLYYVRAYATNSEGTSFGHQVTFTTSQFSVPVLTTTTVTGITQTAAATGGNISFNGGEEVTARGVCWSSTNNLPDISGSKTSDGTGSGSFTSNLTGLTGNTSYFVRAYATNSQGTGYGGVVTFKTNPLLPVVTTANPSATSSTSGSGGGTVSSDGGSSVTAKGVCWSTSPNPTVVNGKTTDGTGLGTFASNITGLAVNTTYHVRAYATNSVGTSYGADRMFTTDPVSINDNDGNSYDIIRIGTQLWMKQNLKTTTFNDNTAITLVTGNSAWSNLSSQGYCWYENNVANKNTYGALYNWYAVTSGKLCPTGWHVSTDNDWITLEVYLGGSSPAGGKLKETGTSHWLTPNTGATNEFGFTALPGGWRRGDNGTFESVNSYGYWWTATEHISPEAWHRKIWYNDDKTYRDFRNGKYGMSVRCIQD